MKVADIILEQLDGNKFLAMTGAKNLLADYFTPGEPSIFI